MFLKKEIIRRNTLYPEKLQDIHRIFWGLQIGFETRSDRAIIPLAQEKNKLLQLDLTEGKGSRSKSMEVKIQNFPRAKMLAKNITKSCLWCQRNIPVNETNSLEKPARFCKRCLEKILSLLAIFPVQKNLYLAGDNFTVERHLPIPQDSWRCIQKRVQTSDSEPGGVWSGKARAKRMWQGCFLFQKGQTGTDHKQMRKTWIK